jgi:hypothetical protein
LREELRRHKLNILNYIRTGQCHHELEPEECNVCNGYVRRLIEEGMSEEWAEAEVLGLPQPVVHAARDRGEGRT